MLHQADGRPTLAALRQRYTDLRLRNTLLAAQVADTMVALYPRHIEGWFPHFMMQTVNASRSVRDSVARWHQQKLHELLPDIDTLDARLVTHVVFYAGGIGDTATERVWRRILLQRFPNLAAAKQQRVFVALDSYREQPALLWPELERLWESGGAGTGQLPFSAFQYARMAKDVGQMRRWGARAAAVPVLGPTLIIGAFMEIPELRAEGMNYIRAYLKQLDSFSDEKRSLTQTRPDHRSSLQRVAGQYLAQLGQALVDAGHTESARDTLNRAVSSTWNVALFRTVAGTRLTMGDTVGALPLFARIAVDPATPPTFADSIVRLFAAHMTTATWRQWLLAAEDEMQRHIMVHATNRPARGPMRLQDPTGKTHTFEPAHETATFIALWSRYCPPSLAQLPALEQVVKDLTKRGVRVITITDEDPSAALRAFVLQHGLTFAYYHDAERDARRTLDAAGTPTYLVLDRSGTVRFASHALDDVIRQVWLLQRSRVRNNVRRAS